MMTALSGADRESPAQPGFHCHSSICRVGCLPNAVDNDPPPGMRH
jgi:hypothetical protein